MLFCRINLLPSPLKEQRRSRKHFHAAEPHNQHANIMGDRANIVFTNHSAFPSPVFLYTHWGGYDIKETLKSALKRGEDQWTDAQYLSRIVFSEMIGKDNWDENTGAGISTIYCDGERKLLVVDVKDQKVRELSSVSDLTAKPVNEWTFPQFVAAEFADPEESEE
jgi:hypothetical protein